MNRPTLLLNVAQMERNIGRMVAKTAAEGVIFRPHFKTHQSAELGQLFRAHGLSRITVSSLDMATYFADHGWGDITVAVPANVREMDKINALAQRITLNLLVENPTTAATLAAEVRHPLHIWLEMDTGYHRTGVPHNEPDAALAIWRIIHAAPQLHFAGLLTHAGHSYLARTTAELADLHQQTIGRLRPLQTLLLAHGQPTCPLSLGDTPTASVLDHFPGADELRPGNFVFYDLMQAQIGACTPAEIAVAVACPVIAIYPHRQQVMLYGGAVQFGKERLVEEDGRVVYGYLAAENWSGYHAHAALTGLSQEHGTLTITDPALLARIQIGDMLSILPVHSCLTADLYDHYNGTDGRRYGRIPRQP